MEAPTFCLKMVGYAGLRVRATLLGNVYASSRLSFASSLSQLPSLRHFQSAIFGLPVAIRRFGQAVPPGEIAHLGSRLGLLQNPYNLFCSEPHSRHRLPFVQARPRPILDKKRQSMSIAFMHQIASDIYDQIKYKSPKYRCRKCCASRK